MKKKYLMILILFLVLPLITSTVEAIPMPQGVGGQIKINNIPVNGLIVSIKNINTGETHTTTTAVNQKGELGFYAVVIDALQKDVISLSVTYNSRIYYNNKTVDLSNPTLWINLSIETTTEPPDGDGNIPPPPSGGNHPPVANFTYSPDKPSTQNITTFRDKSTDPDNDILSWTWTIDGQIYTGKLVSYAFQEWGIHTVTLVVADANRTMSVIQKKIDVTASEDGNPVETKNITVFIQIKDETGAPIGDARIEIYSQAILIETTYTNETGIAPTTIPQGVYTIQVSYQNRWTYQTYTFSADNENLILFLPQKTSPQPTPSAEQKDEGINLWLVALIGFIIVLIIFFILWRLRK